MNTILVVDDNETIRIGLAQTIRKMEHQVVEASSGHEGLTRFREAATNPSMSVSSIDFVITDLKMDGMDGVALLRHIIEIDPDCPILIMTAFGTVKTAVEAMRLGAFDFLEKPFPPEVVRLKVERALEVRAIRLAQRRLEVENSYLRAENAAGLSELIGDSVIMKKIKGVISRVAQTESSVLIRGESGTGKELVARALHAQSPRSDGPFIRVNCGALSDDLLESELFGHEKGAFTGAIKKRQGRFELAEGGTLFLDEIGDISATMQVKLLRILQEEEFERVGGELTVKSNARIIAATHRDLRAQIAAGHFREDLYYRLDVVPLIIPPLREHREDIPDLVRHFLTKLAARTLRNVEGVDDRALGQLITYDWPGNVRELENAIEQALIFTDGATLSFEALPERIRGLSSQSNLTLPSDDVPLPDVLEHLEEQLILATYRRAQGVKTETARRLGIKTSALYYKLEKYGIREPSEN